jgi:ATP-binding cassette, subfamily B, bacterial
MRGGFGGPFGAHAIEEQLSRQEAGGVLRRLGRFLRPWRGRIVLGVVLLVGQTACLLAGPALVRHGIDAGLRADDAGALNLSALLYLVVAVTALFLGRTSIWVVSRVGEQFLRELRVRVFRHLQSLGLDFFEREKTGRLVARLTSDVDALQELVQIGLTMFVQNALLFVGALVVIFTMSWELALCTLVVVPPVVVASRWFRRESNRAYLEVRDRIGTNLATLQEGLAGVRVVQAFGRERAFTSRFHETNEAQFDANLRTVKISTRYFPFVEFNGVIGIALIVGVGGLFVDQGIVTVGTVAAFVLYLNNLFEPVQQLSQLYNTLQQAGAALHKLFGLLDTRPSIRERPGAVDLPRQGALEVDHISFAYASDHDVLHEVTLRVAPGERLALVGPTGAGKSTLAKLIARFYDPRVGTVAFGGVDLVDATLRSLRERIAVVPQEGYLFAGTIRDNVRVGHAEATDAEIDAALEALGIRERFASLAEGLDTEVRERGSRLSAGERQLVSLARAALADPTVLVLDEATSNLDPGTEQEVERALEALTEKRTVVVVAHRLSTAARADRIAVVDHGVLCELGTHAELLRGEGRYAALWASWSAAQHSGARQSGAHHPTHASS